MQYQDKTEQQLIDALNQMRRKVGHLEAAEATYLGAEKTIRESKRELKRILSASPVGIVHTHETRIYEPKQTS